MDNMNITSAHYNVDIEGNNISVNAVIDGETLSIPLDPDNRHYAELMRQVAAGELTIADAE